MTKQRTGIIGSRVSADVGATPTVFPTGAAPVASPVTYTVAHFTPRELDTLRSICRDSDNELGTQFLKAALARAGAK